MVKLLSPSMALCLALVSTSMAQSTSMSTKTATAPATPTGAPEVGLPIFIVFSPVNNTVVHQGQSLSIIASFENKRAITSLTASISKADGSGNQTVATSTIPNMLRSVALWNITSDFPVGNYNINVQAKPILILPSVPGQLAPPTLPPMNPVYYWDGVITVQNTVAPTSGSGSSGSSGGGGAGSTSGASSLSKFGRTATSMVAITLGALSWL